MFGSKYNSIFPVDELRALDTTRIYAAKSSNLYAVKERAEKAADQRFCLNRMSGGQANPLTLMLAATLPRTRPGAVAAVPMTWEAFEGARAAVADTIVHAEVPQRQSMIHNLARLDMSIHAVARPDGTEFMWSLRDTVARAAVRGDLSVQEYEAFLTAIGETVVWPDK